MADVGPVVITADQLRAAEATFTTTATGSTHTDLEEFIAQEVRKHLEEKLALLVACLAADPQQVALINAVLLGQRDAHAIYADWLYDAGRIEQSQRIRSWPK